MIKRLADWLEKMSIGLILAGIFQQILAGKKKEGYIILGIGSGCLILSLVLTYIEIKRSEK